MLDHFVNPDGRGLCLLALLRKIGLRRLFLNQIDLFRTRPGGWSVATQR